MNDFNLKDQTNRLLRRFTLEEWNGITPKEIFDKVGPTADDINSVMPDKSLRIFSSEGQLHRALEQLVKEKKIARIQDRRKHVTYGVSPSFQKLSRDSDLGKRISEEKTAMIRSSVQKIGEIQEPSERRVQLLSALFGFATILMRDMKTMISPRQGMQDLAKLNYDEATKEIVSAITKLRSQNKEIFRDAFQEWCLINLGFARNPPRLSKVPDGEVGAIEKQNVTSAGKIKEPHYIG